MANDNFSAYPHELFLSQGMLLSTLTFKNRIDQWLLIAKMEVQGGIKRVCFIKGRTPRHCMDTFMKEHIAGTLRWKDDTPYQSPIPES